MGLRDKSVIVIGTGIGGAGVAALLAKEGAKVLVLERNDFPGGKAASFEREGFVYDTGRALGGPGREGPPGRDQPARWGETFISRCWSRPCYVDVGGKRACLTQDMDDECRRWSGSFDELGVLPENREGSEGLLHRHHETPHRGGDEGARLLSPVRLPHAVHHGPPVLRAGIAGSSACTW